MGLFDFFKRETLTLTNDKTLNIFGVNQDSVNVTTKTAMTHTTVYSCVNVKAQGISSVPFNLYKKTDNGREKATDHPLFNILNMQVNPVMTSQTWRELVVQDIELRGTHFSQIVRNNAGKVVALYPLEYENIIVDLELNRNNEPTIKYTYTNSDGYARTFKEENILRIVGLPSSNGILGITPITQNSLSIGLGMSAEIFGEKFFSNGANGSGILSTDGEFKTSEAMERIRSQFGEKYKGLANSKKPILLEGGMKWQPITISNNDSQFLETRQFQKSEIASIFRVSPHLINDLSKATFSNITELSQEHVKYCLMPLGVKIESAINIQLLTKQEQKKYYCELNYDGMLRGNFKERSEGYKEAINAGWMKPNEVRRKENLPTEEFGDKLIMQMQYTTLENIENGDSNETITE
jgi:HK97 family phage portal protein